METIIIVLFCLGYLFIALEHSIGINKTAAALVTGVLCWTVYILYSDSHLVGHQLLEQLGEISSILFFLMGAMTIVGLIDSHDGFEIINRSITTKNERMLLWIICLLTFFLSAVLDNLTTTIVMVTLCVKLLVVARPSSTCGRCLRLPLFAFRSRINTCNDGGLRTCQ